MRIIAGVAKGRRLASPRGLDTRPMQDRVREAVFSSLGGAVAGGRVLDLYAGTGSMGLEALSRGAASAVFVEAARAAVAVLRANVETVGLGGTVVHQKAERFLSVDKSEYDLVFVDPPYPLSLASVEDVLVSLEPRLAEGATVIVHRRVGEPPPTVAGMELVDARRYGGAQVWRFREDRT